MRLVRASNGQAITIDPRRDKLGAGGEGTVYSVAGALAAKVYKKPDARRDKILAMLADPPIDDSTPDHDSIAWPIDTLHETGPSGRFVGYLMKRVENAGSFREVAHFKNRRTHRPHFTNYELHVVALNIAAAFSALHKKGYVVGDVNDRNILVNELGLATLLDTDSFQVPKPDGSGHFRCSVKTPEFTPPELQQVSPASRDRGIEHDLFGLGVLIFQLLMQGNHPFNGSDDHGWTIPTRIEKGNFPFGRKQSPIRPPRHAPPVSVLGDELGKLVARCFEDGAADAGARPRAAEWRRALDRARQDLVECGASENHRHPSAAAECPWCKIRREVTLKGGGGLDYFPATHAQVPLARPARRKVLAGSSASGGSSSSGQSAPGAPGARAPRVHVPAATATASPPPTQSGPTQSSQAAGDTPTLADFALRALGSLASAWLTTRVGGGGVPTGAGTQAEIAPGRWEFELTTPLPPLTPGPALLGGQVQLAPDGTFDGSGMLLNMFTRNSCHLGGQWRFDSHSRELSFSSYVNGMAAGTETLRVVGGNGWQVQVANAVGRIYAFRRLS